MATRSRCYVPLLLIAVLTSSVLGPARSAAAEAERPYDIDPSTARVAFELGATLHNVHGRTDRASGRIGTTAGTAAQVTDLTGSVQISVAGLETGNRRRDKKMHEESFDVGKYAEITFQAKHLGPGTARPDDTTRTSRTLIGNLTIRGVARDVEIPVVIEERVGRLIVEGTLTVRWADFGIPDPSFLFVRIQPTVLVTFHIELVPAN